MTQVDQDRFGNPIAPGVPYARGQILPDTAADLAKLHRAGELLQAAYQKFGSDGIFQLSGLSRHLRLAEEDGPVLDDELALALFSDRLRQAGLAHLGGDPARHDIMLLNRLTGALLLAADVMIRPGDKVLGVSPRYSHPAVSRAVAHGGGLFRDCAGLAAFEQALQETPDVSTVFVTRLAVSYEILSTADLVGIFQLAKARGAKIIVDDAGGARVGPAVFDQPSALELGADVCATGLDKYGTDGPRLGLLGGDKELVRQIRVRAYETGLEARQMLYPAVIRSLEGYDPQTVRDLVANTKAFGAALMQRLGSERVQETPVIVQLPAEDIFEIALQRAGLSEAPIVPYEATAALAMLLVRDYRVLTVHFAGIPPGTAALMFKFLPAETLDRFGGEGRLAEAVDDCLSELSTLIGDEAALRDLLLGAPA